MDASKVREKSCPQSSRFGRVSSQRSAASGAAAYSISSVMFKRFSPLSASSSASLRLALARI